MQIDPTAVGHPLRGTRLWEGASWAERRPCPVHEFCAPSLCDINDREFKIAVLKILKETQENTDRQFNALRKQISEQSKYFTKEIETVKKSQSEILEMKHAIKEMKSKLLSIENRTNQMEEIVILKSGI